ncbi:MAG: regulatory YrvL family protein [Clostridia bacterium]
MKEKNNKYISAILAVIILIITISILSIFGGTIMKIFGFEYHSIGSIIMFFIIVGLLGFPIEMLAKGLPNALLSLNKISLNIGKLLFLILDTIATVVAMTIVDYFMESISATSISIFMIAVIMALIGVRDIKPKQ